MRTTLRAVSCFVVSACLAGTVWAQRRAHMIVTPNDLKWEDVAALPPGAKIAVIEGKMNQEVHHGPVKLPANYKIPPHYHSGGAGHRAVRDCQYRHGRQARHAEDNPHGSRDGAPHAAQDAPLRLDHRKRSFNST